MIFACIVVTFTVTFLTLVISDPCTSPGKSINASSGHISSLNFPNNYEQNRTCTWNITVPSGKIIKLTFLNFTLVEDENTDCCGAAASSARVFITNVASYGGDPNTFKLCGQKLPSPVYSEGNFIQVKFESRSGIVNKGFNATFETTDGDSQTKPTSKATAKTESTTTKDRRQSTSAPTESLSAGAAVGIALGCLAFLLLVFVVGYSSHRYVKKNKRRISPNNEGNEMEKGS